MFLRWGYALEYIWFYFKDDILVWISLIKSIVFTTFIYFPQFHAYFLWYLRNAVSEHNCWILLFISSSAVSIFTVRKRKRNNDEYIIGVNRLLYTLYLKRTIESLHCFLSFLYRPVDFNHISMTTNLRATSITPKKAKFQLQLEKGCSQIGLWNFL